MLFALATYSIPSSHKTFLLFDIQGLQNTCISCTWIFIRKKCHWRNFIELIIFYIKLLKYTFLSLNIHSVQNTYILTIQLELIHQRKIFELFTIYPVYIYHEVVEYLVFHAIHDRIIKPFCSHTSFVMHKYTRFCAVVNALQPFAHHS